MDRIFWEVLNEDHLALLTNAVEWANGGRPGDVEGPEFWISRCGLKKSMTVNLVNLTNPMMMRGSFRTLLPAESSW